MAEIQKDKPSDEADQRQIRLAKAQGRAFQDALEEMAGNEAEDGAAQKAGDYIIAYAVEEAEGMYVPAGNDLEWHNPTDENIHIEVVVADAVDGRFVPYLEVTATVLDDQGNEIGTHPQPFMWHSWLYHYGRNWKLPKPGNYTIKVAVAPPQFHRHDKGNGRRYARPVEVEFKGVDIRLGQKKA